MLQKYLFQLADRTGRLEESVGTGNTVMAAAQAVRLNAELPRASGGLGMMPPVQMRLKELVDASAQA